MTRDPHKSTSDPESTPETEADNATSLLDSVYEVALDPTRYGELVTQWHRELQATGAAADATAPLAEHFERATEIMERVHPDDWHVHNDRPGRLAKAPNALNMPELTLSRSGAILAANYGAAALLNAHQGSTVDELDLPARAREAVLELIARIANERSQQRSDSADHAEPKVLRITRISDDRPLVTLLSSVQFAGKPAYQLRCAEIVWPEAMGPVLAQAFKLTVAECEIVQALVGGLNTAGIAETRGTSKATVRTQIREILAKTGTHSQLELIRMTIGFSMMSQQAEARSALALPPSQSQATQSQQSQNKNPLELARSTIISQRSGRALQIIEYGPPAGEPVLVFHDEVIGDAFVLPLLRKLQSFGAESERRFIVPIRAGFGATTAMNGATPAERRTHDEETYQTLARLLKDSQETSILAHGNGVYFAIQFARHYQHLCGPITALTASFPLNAKTAGSNRAADSDLDLGGSSYATFMAGMSRRAPSMLRFAVQAGFAMYARVGARRFLNAVYGEVDIDKQVIQDDMIMADLEHGGRITLAQGYRGFLLDEQTLSLDWTADLLATPVSLRLLLGDQEQPLRHTRAEHLSELSPRIKLVHLRDAGFFAAFSATSAVLDALFSD